MTELNRAGQENSLGHIDTTQKTFRDQIDVVADELRQLAGNAEVNAPSGVDDPLNSPFVIYVDAYTGKDTFIPGAYTDSNGSTEADRLKRIELQRLECGYTLARPFRTMARACLEAALITSKEWLNTDSLLGKALVSIVIQPGEHLVLNGIGAADTDANFPTWKESDDINDAWLTAFNPSIVGGLILPRGCSVVSMDLRKTILKPAYVPTPEAEEADYSNRRSIFRVTGQGYYYGFTFKDGPFEYSHHLLTCFEYASQAQLDEYYSKIKRTFLPEFSISDTNTDATQGEYQIVGPQPPAPVEAVDTVGSASPYIYNCSIRSIWGLCGVFANGAASSGFRSMVIAQLTGVSLQRDMRCWQKYASGAWGSVTYDDYINSDPDDIRMDPEQRSFHVRAVNNSVIQEVSVFAIGQGIHHQTESGGELTVTNSNSNFGGCAALAEGFKAEAAPTDGPWITQALKVARDPFSKENNIRQVFIGSTSSSNSSTIVLNDPLEPSETVENQPELLVRQDFSLKEGDYVWCENPLGPDYRAKISSAAWQESDPTLIGIQSGLTTDNADNNRPPGYIIPGVYPQPSPDHPALQNFRVYVRRVIDVRTVKERQVRLLILGDTSKRFPNRDYVVQPVTGADWTTRISSVISAESSKDINTVSSCISLGVRYSNRPYVETTFDPDVYYRPADTVIVDNKHLSATQINYGPFDPDGWEESYVHTEEEYNPEGYYSNENPLILFDGDTVEAEDSQTLGFSLSTPIISAQIYSSVDYNGLYQVLRNQGQSEAQAHALLLPRPADTRLQDISGLGFEDVEMRRPSNIRLYGHAYEWTGFGQYTKALPLYQRTMTPYNKFTYYFTNQKGGKVYASGFNEEGLLVTPRGLEDLTTGEVLNFESIADNDFVPPEPPFPTELEELTVNYLTVNNVDADGANITGQPCFTEGLTSSGDIFVNANCSNEAVERGIRLAVDGTCDADLYISGTSGVFTYADDNGTPFPLPGDGIGPWIKVPGSDVIGQNAAWIVTAAIAGGGGGPFSAACYCALSGADTRSITAMGPQPNHNGHGIVELRWSTTGSIDVAYLQIRMVGWDLLKVMQMKVNAQRLFGTGQDLLDPYPVSSSTRSGEPRLF